MVFSSPVFLFLFLPLTIAVYFLTPAKYRQAKNIILMVFSLLFYAWGETAFVFAMIFSIIFNYYIATMMGSSNRRKIWLIIGVCSNLLFLIVFKYSNMLVGSLNSLTGLSLYLPPIPLPIGISFFTFQAMSYIIDVYRGNAKIQKSIINLALYISLFPQLIAGPIVRYKDVSEQIESRKESLQGFSDGVFRFIIGLSKKLLIANIMAECADKIFAMDFSSLSMPLAFLGIIARVMQLYFDFSGYSCMAIGLGKMFGFSFIENFNYPYISTSVKELWRRWHISLTNWFKDYLYIPLGGSRCSKGRHYLNIVIVFACTGIWHGAGWNFLFFGLWNAIFLILESAGIIKPKKGILSWLYTMAIWIISSAFFFTDNLGDSLSFIAALFGANGISIADNTILQSMLSPMFIIAFIAAVIASTPVLKNYYAKIESARPNAIYLKAAVLFVLFILCMINLASATYNPFIYFRF